MIKFIIDSPRRVSHIIKKSLPNPLYARRRLTKYVFIPNDTLTPSPIRQNRSKDLTPPESLSPLHKSLSFELKQALKNIKNQTTNKKPQTRLQRLEKLTLPMATKPSQHFSGFVSAMFSLEPSPYRLTNFSAQQDNLGQFKGEEILHQAKKILKYGIKKKEAIQGSEIENFWKIHISTKSLVRWDTFEENLVNFLYNFMACDYGLIRKVNWKTVIHKLYKDLGDFNHFHLWPKSHSCPSPPEYSDRTVSLRDFTRMIQRGKLVKILETSLQDTPFYIASMKTSSQHVYADGAKYIGECNSGKKHGTGKLSLPSGDTFEGNFLYGQREDYGVLSGNSYCYKGVWKRDVFHGYGELKFPDKSEFTGIWEKGQMKYGTLKWHEGTYEGEFINCDFDGHGVFTLENGEVRKGYWNQGCLYGEVEITKPEGDFYKGIFADSNVEGDGILETNEFSYKGNLELSLPCGKGKMKWKNGDCYKGEFKEGKMHGQGRLDTSEKIIHGFFSCGLEHGLCEIQWKNGNFYKGQLSNGKIKGLGEMVYAESHEYEQYNGYFSNGQFNGKGTLRFKNGHSYEGEWKNSRFSGLGILKKGPLTYIGNFAKGKFHGKGEFTYGLGSFRGNWQYGVPEGEAIVKDWDGEKYTGNFKNGEPVKKHKLDPKFLEVLNQPNL